MYFQLLKVPAILTRMGIYYTEKHKQTKIYVNNKNKKPGNKRPFDRRMDKSLHTISGGCPWGKGFFTL